jgi:GT2 family glycosyltransferase
MYDQSKSQTIPSDFYVVECNSHPDNFFSDVDVTTIGDINDEFLGKCHGHNVLVDSLDLDDYDYLVISMNDAVIEDNTLEVMLNYMESDSKVGLLAPRYKEKYKEYTYVDSFDYIFFMIRADLVKQGLFLDRQFKYCWGAIHDLCFRSYEQGFYAAICPEIKYKHLGGNTYGKTSGTISREKYLKKAPTFAYNFFKNKFGNKIYKNMLATGVYPSMVNTNRLKKNLNYWWRMSL